MILYYTFGYVFCLESCSIFQLLFIFYTLGKLIMVLSHKTKTVLINVWYVFTHTHTSTVMSHQETTLSR